MIALKCIMCVLYCILLHTHRINQSIYTVIYAYDCARIWVCVRVRVCACVSMCVCECV